MKEYDRAKKIGKIASNLPAIARKVIPAIRKDAAHIVRIIDDKDINEHNFKKLLDLIEKVAKWSYSTSSIQYFLHVWN